MLKAYYSDCFTDLERVHFRNVHSDIKSLRCLKPFLYFNRFCISMNEQKLLEFRDYLT